MSALIGALRVTLGLDSAAFEQGANAIVKRSKGMERSLTKLGKGMVDLGQKLSIALTVPLAAFGVASFRAASDAAELQSAFDQTFGAMSAQMNEWARITGDAMGRSTQEIQEGANTFGIFFNQAAKSRAEAAELSKTFAVLAQDLSSFYNVDPGEAIGKLRSGLSGESEPLRDFGVFLTEATVKARAMKMGLADASGEISEQAKILARANLILEATKNAQGDVARTADGTANRIRAAKAAFEELKITVGQKLIPVITPLIERITELLNRFAELPPRVQTMVVGFGAAAAVLGPLLLGIGSLIKVLAPLIAVLSTVAGEAGLLVAFRAGVLGLAGTGGGALVILIGVLAAVAAGLVWMNKQIDHSSDLIEGFNVTVGEAEAFISKLNEKSLDGERTQQAFGGAVDTARKKMKAAADDAQQLINQLYGVEAAAYSASRALANKQITASWDKINDLNAERARIAQAGLQWGPGGLNERRSQALLFGQYLDETKRLTEAQRKLELLDKDFSARFAARGKAMAAPIAAATGEVGKLSDKIGGTGRKAREATGQVASSFKSLADELAPLMDRLFPERAKLREYRDELALIDKAMKSQAVSADLAAEARRRLALEGYEKQYLGQFLEAEGQRGIMQWDELQKGLEKLTGVTLDWAGKSKVVAVQVAKSFKDMADDTISALDRVAGAIRGGGFLDILSSVIGLGLQLGSIGAFGKTIQTNLNTPKIPAYAGGTGFHAGGLAMVGERGPEVVDLPRGSKVWPNGSGPGGTTVTIVPSPYFDAHVDGRAAKVAAPMAAASGHYARQAASSDISNRARRRIPA